MKRSASASGLTSLVLALICFAAAAVLFHTDGARGESPLFIADSRATQTSR
jgi:hypothetical protein